MGLPMVLQYDRSTKAYKPVTCGLCRLSANVGDMQETPQSLEKLPSLLLVQAPDGGKKGQQ